MRGGLAGLRIVMPGIMSQATARPSHGETFCTRTVLRLVCFLTFVGVVAARAPAGSGYAITQLSTSADSEVLSSSSFSRQLVQEQVNLLPILALRSLPASSGYAKLEGPLSFREQGDILLLNQVLLWMITV